MKSLNHADGPVPLLYYHLFFIMNCVFAKMSMFCTLIRLLNQVFFLGFFFWGKQFVRCHILDAAPPSLMCLYVWSQLLMMFSATDEGDVTDRSYESVTNLVLTGLTVLNGITVKKNCYKSKKCKLHIRNELDPPCYDDNRLIHSRMNLTWMKESDLRAREAQVGVRATRKHQHSTCFSSASRKTVCLSICVSHVWMYCVYKTLLLLLFLSSLFSPHFSLFFWHRQSTADYPTNKLINCGKK